MSASTRSDASGSSGDRPALQEAIDLLWAWHETLMDSAQARDYRFGGPQFARETAAALAVLLDAVNA